MFDQILVGVDGQDGGRDAISLARELATQRARIVLAHVYPGNTYVWAGASPTYWPATEDEIQTLLESARREAGIEASLRYTTTAPVAHGLHELAEDVGADLLVVGSSRRGLLGRVLMGDDARATLSGAPCAVAIAPRGYAQEPHLIREIGVAYNGSPESEQALATARRLATRYGARLSAFHAVSLPSRITMSGGLPHGGALEAMVAQARSRIAQLGGVVPHAVYGDPAQELTLYSASVDVLVVGSRGYGPIGRVVHGSTSQELARRARSPLLVLTRSARVSGEPSSPGERSRDPRVLV
jgi:nucleotide-binding universal stress UspA family protein